MSTLLDPEALARLGPFAVRTTHIAQGALAGLHEAQARGSSIEFDEYKQYSPGDEIKNIDWKVYGRANRYYVRQFENESELTAYLVVDTSASMAYGEEFSKLAYAAHLAGALGYLLSAQRDRVGLVTFGDSIEVIPARNKSSHLHQLLSVLETSIARGGTGSTSLGAALAALGDRLARRRALILVASDLFDTGTALEELGLLRARGCDVAVFHILHRDEIEFPFTSLTRFEGLEQGSAVVADPLAIRKEYLARFERYLSTTKRTLAEAGVDRFECPVDLAIEQSLLQFLTRPKSRSRSVR